MEKRKWTDEERALKVEEFFKSDDTSITEYVTLIGIGRSTFNRWIQQYRMAKNQSNLENTKPVSPDHDFVELVCELNQNIANKCTIAEPLIGVEIKLPSQVVLTLPQVLPATLVTLVKELNHAYSSH